MSFTNTPERYGVISAAFHWLSAIIVYGMFALGLWMVTLSSERSPHNFPKA